MSNKLLSKISKLEKQLAEIKLELKGGKSVKSANTAKPKKIDEVESKEQLNKFSVTELKEYVKKNKINVKKITEKHKADFVEIVWKYLNDSDSDDSGSDGSGEEEEDDEEEEYEWYYY